MRVQLGLPPVSPARGALVLFLLERTCDAIAQGEARALGISFADLTRSLEAAVARELA